MIVPVRIRCGVWLIVTSLLAVTVAEAASAGGAFATSTSVSLKSISRDIAASSGRSVGRNLVRSHRAQERDYRGESAGFAGRQPCVYPSVF